MEKSATLNLRVNPTLKPDAETVLCMIQLVKKRRFFIFFYNYSIRIFFFRISNKIIR